MDGTEGIHASPNFIIINIILILFMKYRGLCQQKNKANRPPHPALSPETRGEGKRERGMMQIMGVFMRIVYI
jgi:hypothetical protein